MYERFGLVLSVTHACNLRCTYCYAGTKFRRTMEERIGRKSIDRAIGSLSPGGTLELGFFGGEPLLEADRIGALIDYARMRTAAEGIGLRLNMTTNGTVADAKAWSIMMLPEVGLTISCDGLPAVHDRHRRVANGNGSSKKVVSTIRRLVAAGRAFRVVMVVRPDTVERLAEGIEFLHELGVRRVEPSLDVWTQWTAEDISRLEQAIARCARLWRSGLPKRSIGWFDDKAAQLARIPRSQTARCGFGHGEIAVAPSGRLYPCERLIGEDADDNPMMLPGHALEGEDFLDQEAVPKRSDAACDECVMTTMCNTFCRCSNYVRTGDVRKPDRLLCTWNQACLEETAKVMKELIPQNCTSG